MDKQKQACRVGSLVILLAILLRMICSSAFGDNVSLFSQPRLASFLLYTETGRDTTEPVTTAPPVTTTAPLSEPEPEPEPVPKPVVIPSEKPKFTADDMEFLSMQIDCRRDPDELALLLKPLKWDLTGDEPQILIIHTHGTEAYTPTANSQYQEYGGEFRTADDRYNMISIGDELTRLLEEAGLKVIHDRTPYDKDDYLDSYEESRKAVKEHLKEHPSIRLILDLHRDAAEYADGTQWATSATVNGRPAAQVMMVVGTNATGLNHPNWETNLSIAEKLTVLMEKHYPGTGRNVNLRGARFNQDLAMGALIAEIGAAGNTHEEAILGVSVLADAIIRLSLGSE